MEDLDKTYYENLKNESYKTMLDSEIQASVARDQAMKYTQNQMNATGYGNQGLAQSSMVGIQNNYRNALADAAKQYDTSINEINQSELQNNVSQDNNNFQSATTLMSNATSQDVLNQIYDSYKQDNSLSENSKKQLELLYSIYSDSFSSSATLPNMQFNLDDESAIATDKNGKTTEVSLSSKFGSETTTLKKVVATNSLPNDSYVKISNSKGYSFYVRYYNNQLYYVSADEYNNSTNKYSISGSKDIVKA